jgi:hypothetical protein
LSLTTLTIADKLASRGVTAAGPDVETWLPEALFRVALANADAPEFEKAVAGLTVTSGVLTNTDGTLIFGEAGENIRRVTVNATPAYRAPSYDSLRAAGLPADAHWYACEGSSGSQQSLHFRALDGTLGSLSSSSNVTVVCPAVPTLSNLPARFEPALIEELVRTAQGGNK